MVANVADSKERIKVELIVYAGTSILFVKQMIAQKCPHLLKFDASVNDLD